MPNLLRYGGIEDENGHLKPSDNLDEFYQWAGLGPESKVLDAGCGYGRNYIALSKKGCKVYGVDISEEALDNAKKFLKEKNITRNLVRGSIKNLPFPEGVFDAVYGNAIPAKDTANMWKDVTRVLRKGRKAYIKFIQGITHLDIVEHPEYKEHDFEVNTEDIKRWFKTGDKNYKIEFEELGHVLEKGEYGSQLTTKLLVKIERI